MAGLARPRLSKKLLRASLGQQLGDNPRLAANLCMDPLGEHRVGHRAGKKRSGQNRDDREQQHGMKDSFSHFSGPSIR